MLHLGRGGGHARALATALLMLLGAFAPSVVVLWLTARAEGGAGVCAPISMIASLIGIPERTLARRKTAGRLTSEESERLLRVSTIFEKAVELFEGDIADAVKWLTTSQRALGHNPPWAFARTELGAREVENLIGRLEHGVFS